MDIDEDYKDAEKRIKALPKKKQAQIRKAIELYREKDRVRWALRDALEPLTGMEAIMAQRHAAMEYLKETRT